MNYPENAWLLLTHEGLYLMSSEEGAEYHDKIELTEELKMTGITSIEGVPDDWFKQPRDLIISFQEGESPNSDLGSLKICTREPGSSVSLRKGPGTEFEKGLVQVGSGGKGVDDYFRERGYTIQDGSELIYVSEEKKGKDGHNQFQHPTNPSRTSA